MENRPIVAAITGASSGIGQAISIELAQRGVHLILSCHRNLTGVSKTIARIQSFARQKSLAYTDLFAIVSDIADPQSHRGLVEAAFLRHGYIDLWVHAAGADVLTGNARKDSFSTKLSRLWEVDVHGTFLLSRRVASRMLEQSPHASRLPSMVHLGWDQADAGMEGDSGQYFSAIKSAVAAFSKSLAKSLAPRVRVNCVAPGWIQTEWGENALPEWQSRAIGESMLQRWGTPEDIARVIAAISLGDGDFVNGQTIAVNGGWQASTSSIRSKSNLSERDAQ